MSSFSSTEPRQVGIHEKLLSKAIKFAIENESQMDRDIGAALEQGHFEEPLPIGKTIGPVKHRKAGSGVILRKGQLINTWGDVEYDFYKDNIFFTRDVARIPHKKFICFSNK